MSLREVAEYAGVHPSTLSRFEDGKRVQRMDEIVQGYARALEMSAADLWRAAQHLD